jgi:DNA-binding MarR family transcriptional regulator
MADNELGRWISILYRYGQSYLSKKMEPYSIGRGQLIILLYLNRNDGLSQQDLTEYVKIDKGCIAKSIKSLEDEGYITRSTDPDDRRAVKVFLTQKARGTMPVIKDVIKNWESALVSGLKDDEKLLAEQILYKMAKNAYNYKDIR